MRLRDGGTRGDGRIITGAAGTNESPSCSILSLSNFQTLVGNVHLLFQLIQVRVAKELPPIATSSLVPRLSHLPGIRCAGQWRSLLFVFRWNLCRGFCVLGANRTG